MVKVRVLRVFVNERHEFGNPLGIIENAREIPDPQRRQAIAVELGYSETVFVENADTCEIRIYGQVREVPFAGHAAVGAAWILNQINGKPPAVLRAACGEVPAWVDNGATWVRSTLSTTPPWWHERLPTVAAIEELTGPLSPLQDMTQLWAWEDESAGIMRVRTFASRAGIHEDEACGSGAMRLTAALGRRLLLRHGKGSIVHAKPGPPGFADIGGYVVEDRPRLIA